jgi:hypothetical protein
VLLAPANHTLTAALRVLGLASGGLGALGMRLIRLPLTVERAITSAMRAALAPHNDPRQYRAPVLVQT